MATPIDFINIFNRNRYRRTSVAIGQQFSTTRDDFIWKNVVQEDKETQDLIGENSLGLKYYSTFMVGPRNAMGTVRLNS